MNAPLLINAQFSSKMQCIFTPRRTKVFWGGRGASRSWGCARAALLMGAGLAPGPWKPPLRFLCARELQKSIAESVHKLICDQISLMGLNEFYSVQQNKIFGPMGTEFSFEGIKNNVNTIKSYEGIDICWVEEANKVSKNSWGVLLPTIRKKASEIWITFNPELETDYTYERFVINADPDSSFVIHMTWRDNPWLTPELRLEMEIDRRTDIDRYNNIWEGRCVQQIEGAVYAKEMRQLVADGRVTRVPWDREIPIDCFWDLGRADHTSIWFAQRVAMQRRVVEAVQDTGYDISYYIKLLQNKEYTYGTMYLPHDAAAKTLGTKLSIQEQLGKHWKTRVMPKLSITDGINATRLMFPGLWFDEKRCSDGLQALRHYKYKIVDGKYSREPLHDEASDFADALRTMALAMRPRTEKKSMVESLAVAAEATAEFVAGRSHRAGADIIDTSRPRDRGTSWLEN